jgi:hypothetical protein
LKILLVLDIISTIFGIIATIEVDLYVKHPHMLIILSAYLIGTSALCVSVWLRKNYWLMALFGFYDISNLIGIIELIIPTK